MITDKRLLRFYRIKRLQRAIEYVLLIGIFFFFLLAYIDYYRPYITSVLAFVFLGLNLQLTLQRERRKTQPATNRSRLLSDAIESILFLILILLMSIPSFSQALVGGTPQERYALVASVLCGIFLGGLFGEIFFQIRRLPTLPQEKQENYIKNLKRTIILPYFSNRRHS
ncbi:MAG: hypothetical protein J4G05_00930 [Chlorobi bacterium]|nr:hypothetical protein [Chlorobiota bacterium]